MCMQARFAGQTSRLCRCRVADSIDGPRAGKVDLSCGAVLAVSLQFNSRLLTIPDRICRRSHQCRHLARSLWVRPQTF